MGMFLPVVFLSSPSFGEELRLKVLPKKGHKIANEIYGQNDFYSHDDISTSQIRYPIVRFGGNAMSRYNWKTNSYNAGKDWFYLNVAMDIRPGKKLRTDREVMHLLIG